MWVCIELLYNIYCMLTKKPTAFLILCDKNAISIHVIMDIFFNAFKTSIELHNSYAYHDCLSMHSLSIIHDVLLCLY